VKIVVGIVALMIVAAVVALAILVDRNGLL
jgi:hypothetical protein